MGFFLKKKKQWNAFLIVQIGKYSFIYSDM